MNAAIEMSKILSLEELMKVSGGAGGAIVYTEDQLFDILVGPFKKIIKKIIGPHLPSNFEVFYAIVKVSMAAIKIAISDFNPLVMMAFEAYTILDDKLKRKIWRKVYDSLRVEMMMAG